MIKLVVYLTPGSNDVLINFTSGKGLSKSRMSKQCWRWGC